MMMNCFFGMVDRRKALNFVFSQYHCQRCSPSRISETPWAGLRLRRTWFRLCAAVITTSPWRHEANSKLFKKTIYSFICLLFTHVLQSGCHVLTEKYTTFSWLRFPKVQVFFLKTDWFRTMDHSTFKIIND